jgi:hypothetical protein
MASIHLPNISSSALEKTPGIRNISPVLSKISVGETIPVLIAEKSGSSRFMLTMKDRSFLADSDLPLMKGEKIMVTVEQLNPQIILRILNREGTASPIINEYNRSYITNPEALMDMFEMGREIFNQKSLMELLPEKAKESIRNILKIMDALVFSPTSLKNPLFIKDYISNLGLLLEYNLMKNIQEDGDIKNLKPEEGLKGFLIKLSEELRAQGIEGNVADKEDLQKIVQLTKFIETSIKTIENQQMINISYKEGSGNYVLQIPILYPDGIRTGELFIETEKDGDGDTAGKRYHVVMFLNMDALGDIMVDASLAGNKLGCLFKFDDLEAQQFFSIFLDDLKNSISMLGYECGFLNCMTSKTIKETKEDYHRELFSDRCTINVLA